ncbi:MAG TPA: FHA domain-containing protein [Candidatus Gemmiger faecigallinarum]|nr:FHA domain-containing protein [Candidatus Gemmiger faecigallinarum]
MNQTDTAILCLLFLLILAAGTVAAAVLLIHHQNEKEKYLRAAKNLVQEELLNYALCTPGTGGAPPPARRPMLYLRANTDPVQRFVFDPSHPITLGRDPQCSIFVQDPLISQQHCRIQARGGQVFLSDNNSSNGTFVQRGLMRCYRVVPGRPFPLVGGDVICAGQFRLKITLFLFDDAVM